MLKSNLLNTKQDNKKLAPVYLKYRSSPLILCSHKKTDTASVKADGFWMKTSKGDHIRVDHSISLNVNVCKDCGFIMYQNTLDISYISD